MNKPSFPRKRESITFNNGFTLIELVITMVITSIIATVLAPIITRFIDAYDAQLRRGGLVERAQVTLNRITREVHIALPNSIRVNGGTVMEMIRTIDGGRYRSADDPGTEFLDTSQPDANGIFDVLGQLNDCPGINTLAGGGNIFVTMMNQLPGSPTGDAYQGQNIAPVTGCNDNVPAASFSDQITFTPTITFDSSTMHRFQIVDTPVSYICTPDAVNPENGRIVRYHGYTIAAAQPTIDLAIDGLKTARYSHDVLIDKVAACEFAFDSNDGLFTVSITIQDENTNEVIRLMQQVQVENAS